MWISLLTSRRFLLINADSRFRLGGRSVAYLGKVFHNAVENVLNSISAGGYHPPINCFSFTGLIIIYGGLA